MAWLTGLPTLLRAHALTPIIHCGQSGAEQEYPRGRRAMKSVCVQLLPGDQGGGCLSSVDLDSPDWDRADDLRGSTCVRPDQAHNASDNPHVQTLIDAWTTAGVSWITAQDARAQGYRLGAPYFQTGRP